MDGLQPPFSGVLCRQAMKFKLLKSMSHNFSHSFVSLMNYVDDGYVIDDLREMAKRARGETVSIIWFPKKRNIFPAFNKRVRKSITLSRKWLPNHMKNHEVDESMISEMRTDIYMAKNNQIYVKAYIKDIRGKEHIKGVQL